MSYTIRAIIEVMGKPQEHVEQVMKQVVENLKKEPETEVIQSHIAPTEKAKAEIFSTFAEVEVKLTTLNRLNHFCFHYLPSSIEILDTDKITLTARELSGTLNDILTRLHKYNILVTNLHAENAKLKEDQ